MKLDTYDIIKYMMRTEKSTQGTSLHKYNFAISPFANKVQVKKAVERIYNVKVASVNTVINPGKWRRVGRSEGRKPDWKKAVVTLKEGFKISEA
jgi:large subunit ribosomal protein L23